MIRRPPTTVLISESDVHDVKELIKRQKDAVDTANRVAREQAARPFSAPEDAKRKREELTVEERLALQVAQTPAPRVPASAPALILLAPFAMLSMSSVPHAGAPSALRVFALGHTPRDTRSMYTELVAGFGFRLEGGSSSSSSSSGHALAPRSPGWVCAA
ncbi:hypothetical protein BKA62DRAFT_824671 [Auriculariales sp. MPI-PUGE-AT-0066]|nr:hypothetical protein BKA62DRAFT_824671 [Auriculariales sp. MPI-PUGE-AT-0066]